QRPWPVLVLFYGGGWDSGDKTHYAWAAQALAARGFVVALPDYRLVPQVHFPAFIEDAALATARVGEIAGRCAAEMAHPPANGSGASNAWGVAPRQSPVPIISDIRPSDHGELDLVDVQSSLRSSMWRHVGIERIGPRLRDAGEMFDFWARYTLDKIFDDRFGWETQNMLLVGALMARSALWREESRGAHARSDFPASRAEFEAHDLWRRGRAMPIVCPLGSVFG
ncbi:MAG TPA: alpha/beta hydrolase fold domain-containing protein, partial [Phycisphaerales bacterium]|nr:alpha/beta hydrolase fold domain-containing protein [Phycisphaerales bacterium]